MRIRRISSTTEEFKHQSQILLRGFIDRSYMKHIERQLFSKEQKVKNIVKDLKIKYLKIVRLSMEAFPIQYSLA